MGLHAHVQPFGFDRIFGGMQDVERPSGELLGEISQLRAELAELRARQEGGIALARAEGFEAGLSQARHEREVALLTAVDALQAGIEALDGRVVEFERQTAGDAAEVALAAADLLAGRAVEGAPVAAIDDAIGRVLRQVARGTEILVRVHPDLVEPIEARVADRQARDRRRLHLAVIADETLAEGDAMLAWDQGGLVLDVNARRAEIMAELETLLPKAA